MKRKWKEVKKERMREKGREKGSTHSKMKMREREVSVRLNGYAGRFFPTILSKETPFQRERKKVPKRIFV